VFHREKIGEPKGTIPISRKGRVELYLVRAREGSQGQVIDEYELWVDNNLIVVIRDYVELSPSEAPLELLKPVN